MKCRVFYKIDGQISVLHPAEKSRKKEESDIDFLDRVSQKAIIGTELENLPYDDINPATLPNRKDRDKWRGTKETGVLIDNTIITIKEKRQMIEDELDGELTKDTPDLTKVAKLQRKLDKKDYL